MAKADRRVKKEILLKSLSKQSLDKENDFSKHHSEEHRNDEPYSEGY